MTKPYPRWLWLSQVISGILLVLFLALHWIAQHYIVEGGLRSYEDIVHYLQNPFVVILELLFLGIVTFHACIGLRAIFVDLGISSRLTRLVNLVLFTIGVFTIAYGIDLTFDILKWN